MSRSPRVRCGGCAFEWFGPTAAHGLQIVGTCPRCGGVLEFLVPVEDDDPVAEDQRAPASVLGTPQRR
jgi:hypothetical protein